MNDTPDPDSPGKDEPESTAGEIFAYGVAGLLNKERVANAVVDLVEAAAEAQGKFPARYSFP